MFIMKPFSLAFYAATILTLSFVSTKVHSLEDEGAFADAPVTVSVTCNGGSTIDWSKLSLAEITLAGNALTSSYNKVHETLDNDDSQLYELTFNGNGKRRMLQEDENLEWKNRRPVKGTWSGLWGCALCPDDDDPNISGPSLIAWENEFVAGLLESSHEIFQTIKSCTIDLEPDEDTSPLMPNADIDLWCGKHIDLSKLSVAKGTFLAHALQVSYSKAHADIADDDSELTNVYYHKSLPKKKKNFAVVEDFKQGETAVGSTSKKPSPKPAPWYNPKYNNKWNSGGFNSGVTSPGLSGDWSCRLCIQDDDLLLAGQDGTSKSSLAAKKRQEQQLRTASSGDALKAWEAELNVILKEGPFESFRKIDMCEIKLLPHVHVMEDIVESSEVLQTEHGCGIRGRCNDIAAQVA